jgi:hypothetical protein
VDHIESVVDSHRALSVYLKGNRKYLEKTFIMEVASAGWNLILEKMIVVFKHRVIDSFFRPSGFPFEHAKLLTSISICTISVS